jgi:plastocyanin
MNRREFLGAVGTAGTVGVAGCASVLGSGEEYDVGMTAVAFDPPTLTVSVGEEVVWNNTSARGHTVTAADDGIPDEAEYFASGGFESEQAAREAFAAYRREPDSAGNNGLISSGETYRHTFEVAGEYRYICIPHEQAGMVGAVVVEE